MTESWAEYMELRRAGWKMHRPNQIRLNGGSETARHATAKLLCGFAGAQAGYRVSSEVGHEHRPAEVDVILHSHSDRISPVAVECEVSPTEETIEKKLDKYVRGTVLQEMYTVNVTEMPENIMDAYGYVQDELGIA